ncbi:hypothetical protein M378DRAFT_458620 [Amanita muscaria Koide BX008]|uniref:Uncharacterized protein n=1 Tax=Amanita muscaria (strain Koide BX008) TaxID=946122 RepID=A0A0C2X8T9_AMAMK|nr:hypothetical protein M378DRAFT_458620 [Amanita muscaria Koide BX008]
MNRHFYGLLYAADYSLVIESVAVYSITLLTLLVLYTCTKMHDQDFTSWMVSLAVLPRYRNPRKYGADLTLKIHVSMCNIY